MKRTGSIDVTSEGRYRVRQTLPRLGRVTTGIYATREEAEEQCAAQVEVVTMEVEDDGITLFEWGEKWLKARDVGRLVSDPDSDWSRWKKHVKGERLARMTLRSIRRRHVRDWLQGVAKKVARQTTLNTLNIVRGMLAAAVEDELLKANPAAGLKLPKERRTEEPWTYATSAEQYRLIVCADEPERWIIGFAMGSGLRAGELCSLRLSDLHLDGDNPRAVVRYGGPPSEPTKGGKIRTVPLLGLSITSAREWLAKMPTWALRNPNGLVFPRKRGSYRDEIHVLRWDRWQEILEASVGRDFRWHDLRHTAGSSLVSGWWGRRWSLIEVRDFLGHESVTTTERYAHLAGTALEQAAKETRMGGGSTGHDWPRGWAAHKENRERFRVAPPAEIESATFGLGKPCNTTEVPHEYGSPGHRMATAEAHLRALAAGNQEEANRLATELSVMTLESVALTAARTA